MSSRTENLLSNRPNIASAKIYDEMNPEELFQNQTLRPIVKFQHELLISVFTNYISKRKNVYYQLSQEKQIEYINNTIQKDIKFVNSIKGMIIGQFTIEEYDTYIKNSSALNKRITNLIKERLIDSAQLFTKPNV